VWCAAASRNLGLRGEISGDKRQTGSFWVIYTRFRGARAGIGYPGTDLNSTVLTRELIETVPAAAAE